jgi:hypothetical protein
MLYVKAKGKVHPRASHEGPEVVQRYSFFFILGTRWESVVNTTPQPLYLLEGDPVPFVQEAEWVKAPVCMGVGNLSPIRI